MHPKNILRHLSAIFLFLALSLSLSPSSRFQSDKERRGRRMRAREKRRISGIKDANARVGHQNLINQRKNEPGRKPKRFEEEKSEIGEAREGGLAVRRCQRPVRFALMHMPRLSSTYYSLPFSCSRTFNSFIRTCEWRWEDQSKEISIANVVTSQVYVARRI